MLVEEVATYSIAQEIGIEKGDKILKINEQTPKDILEYSFIANDENINLLVEHKNGQLEEYEIEKEIDDDLGIVFSSAVFDCLKKCQNNFILA